MRSSIESKLAVLFSGPIDAEAKAVYLLCQVRKLQDYDGVKAHRLRMFCNWAVHVDLGVPATVEPFLRHVDDVVASKLSGVISTESFRVELELKDDFATFDTFRHELRDVLKRHALSTALCDDDGSWYQFLEHYSGVIEDCTMTLKRPLQHVAGLRFLKQQTGVSPAALTFAPTWLVSLSRPHNGKCHLEFTSEAFAGTVTKAWGHRFL